MYRVIIILCLLMVIFSCAKNKVVDSSPSSLSFGTDETLDIITWNIENFPKQDNITINYLAELIDSLDVDIIVMQEIESETDFMNLIDKLDDWEGYRANSASFNINLALLYSNNLEVVSIYEIFEDDWWSFPRSPLVAQIEWNGQNVYIINNHFKAMGGTDNEDRRKSASEELEYYINNHLENYNVIVIGDLNDDLADEKNINVFQNFINDSTNYKFVDMEIAYGSYTNFSKPDYPSHLDHILITNELFDEFKNPDSKVETIHIENYFDGGWNEYENFVSDHRPVGLRLYFNP